MLLLTAEAMRRLDRETIEGGHASAEQLMERAGAGVVRAMERRYGPALGLRVLLLCGTGNNGGDGLVAARHLRARGAVPQVLLLGPREHVLGEARAHLGHLETEGVKAVEVASEAELARAIEERDGWDFALDALLGTGARGAPEGLIAAGVQALRDLDDAGVRVVAVDLPTGVAADTGEIARRAVRADLTVTFGHPKRGHYLYPGRAFVGALEVVDIGLAAPPAGAGGFAVELATSGEMAALVPVRDPRAHKGSVGRVLVVGGSEGLTGAVTLAAQAATRAGAGYVQVASPASLHDVLEVKLTEEMTLPCAEIAGRALGSVSLPEVLEHARGADAVVLGPGLSRRRDSLELARAVVRDLTSPVVVDADALNAFEGDCDALALGAGPRVLTPHLGEMARLTGEGVQAIEARRIEEATESAARWQSVVVLKGAPTVTGSPDGRATVNPTGNPGMATAGAGDVLSGAIAALIAQGLAPYDAARLAVYAHGLAGDHAAEGKGQHGMSAGDILEALPGALLALARERDAAGPGRSPGRSRT